jgi:hypothetical protein
LGHDAPFRRLWTLYLAYFEAGFVERRICDVQLLLAKPQWAHAFRAGDARLGDRRRRRAAPAHAVSLLTKG